MGLVLGGGLGTAIDAAFATWGIGMSGGVAVGMALGIAFAPVSTSKIENAKCYKQSFIFNVALGGIVLLLGVISLGLRSEALRALATGFLPGAIVFLAIGLAHGKTYWRLSR